MFSGLTVFIGKPIGMLFLRPISFILSIPYLPGILCVRLRSHVPPLFTIEYLLLLSRFSSPKRLLNLNHLLLLFGLSFPIRKGGREFPLSLKAMLNMYLSYICWNLKTLVNLMKLAKYIDY